MRLFIAIQLSEEIRKTLVAFIGEYEDLARVKEILEKVPFSEFRLTLSDTGHFGNILWAGVKGNQKLKAYVKELRADLTAGGIPCDGEKFVPHITLVRKASAKKPWHGSLPKAEMTVKGAALMKSEQKNGKVVYKVL